MERQRDTQTDVFLLHSSPGYMYGIDLVYVKENIGTDHVGRHDIWSDAHVPLRMAAPRANKTLQVHVIDFRL